MKSLRRQLPVYAKLGLVLVGVTAISLVLITLPRRARALSPYGKGA